MLNLESRGGLDYNPFTMDIQTTLRQYFGYDSFRYPQREVIERVLAGQDSVVLMPTGGGKSLCYQLPSLLLTGLTVVISPLIALMRDQVQALVANGINAAYLNSSLTPGEEQMTLSELRDGRIRVLYVSPERLLTGGFFDLLQQLNPCLFAIDEAHCISSWGHNFRPDYRELHRIKRVFPTLPLLALTATADRTVRADIGELLGMRSPQQFISSFDRPNLSLSVLPGQKRLQQLEKILQRHRSASGIIYCLSRKQTEQLAASLRQLGVDAAHYHAGLASTERGRIQDDFIQGKLRVICATIAFGMGIDKSDIRFVVHYNMPSNLEGYYQEIGRAGRDGAPAETVLFYSYADVQSQMRFVEMMPEHTQRQLQEAKLLRMKEYAEARHCRRRILLSYFSEHTSDACNNCDICASPPAFIDGTRPTQIALSAVARSKERLTMSTLVDVLRGTYSPTVVDNGFDQIKTFGAGRELSAFVWKEYCQQFLQQGFLEMDYRDHYTLKLTALSQAVLFEERKVDLVTPLTFGERQQKQAEIARKSAQPTNSNIDPELFDHLRKCRRDISLQIGKPAFVVFSDATLRDMAARTPQDMAEFKQVSGVGDFKAQRYGEQFLTALAEYGQNRDQSQQEWRAGQSA